MTIGEASEYYYNIDGRKLWQHNDHATDSRGLV